MPIQATNYWKTTVPSSDIAVSNPWPNHVDVAVIGGGFTGLAAAHTLAQRGVKVAVFEAEEIGWGASSRNGGMVLTGLKLSMEKVIARYGRDLAGRMFRTSIAAIDYVEQIVQQENINCNFERCGHLELACKPAHLSAFRRSADLLLREFNHPVQILAQNELSAEIESDVYYGGLVDERSAGINPARFVHGLGQAAVKAGAQLFNQTRVQTIARQGNRFRLKTTRGEIQAGQVLAATGAYTTAVAPALFQRIVPVGSYIIATTPLPENLAKKASPRRRMIYDSQNFLHYFRLTPDNRMLFGGRARFLPESPTTIQESAHILERDLLKIYPYLQGISVEYVWGGTLDFTHDRMPHAGELDGLFFSAGYAGHGVALATYLGSLAGQALCGDQVDNPFAITPIPRAPLGLHFAVRPLLPVVAAWHWLQDRIS